MHHRGPDYARLEWFALSYSSEKVLQDNDSRRELKPLCPFHEIMQNVILERALLECKETIPCRIFSFISGSTKRQRKLPLSTHRFSRTQRSRAYQRLEIHPPAIAI